MAAAKRFVRYSIDWAAFAERVDPAERTKYTLFKSRVDGYLRNLVKYPENPPEINWSFYKSRLPAALVSNLETQYKSVKVPYPADKLTVEVNQQEKQLTEKNQQILEILDLRCKYMEKKIQWWNDLMPFDQMTWDDAVDYFDDMIKHRPLKNPKFFGEKGEPQPVFPYRKKVAAQH